MSWRERIDLDPAVRQGRACFAGTRILVASVLQRLADGLSAAELFAEFPTLAYEDVEAARRYAAYLARRHDREPIAGEFCD